MAQEENTQNIRYMTRSEIIDDLPQVFKEQNNISILSDNTLSMAWINYGIHAGTEDWDVVEVIEE